MIDQDKLQLKGRLVPETKPNFKQTSVFT